MATEAKRVLNERLKEKKLASEPLDGRNNQGGAPSRTGDYASWPGPSRRRRRRLIPNAIRNWVGLSPEERWWLFSMAASMTGTAEDVDIGWRKAIRIALTENPTGEEVADLRKKKPKDKEERPQLPLFDR